MKEVLEQSRHSLEWLKFNQRQLDADGVEVAVSRQALDEVLIALEMAIDAAPEMLAALKRMTKLAREVAQPVGSMHAFWDDIFGAEAVIAKAEGRGDG